MKEIKETVKTTGEDSRDAFVIISNQSKTGFHLLSISDETFGNDEITIEYSAVDDFIQKLQEVWELHKLANRGE